MNETSPTVDDDRIDDLRALVDALCVIADSIFDGHLAAEKPDEDNPEPYCFECDLPWPCDRAKLAAALAQVTEDDDGRWDRSAVLAGLGDQ